MQDILPERYIILHAIHESFHTKTHIMLTFYAGLQKKRVGLPLVACTCASFLHTSSVHNAHSKFKAFIYGTKINYKFESRTNA